MGHPLMSIPVLEVRQMPRDEFDVMFEQLNILRGPGEMDIMMSMFSRQLITFTCTTPSAMLSVTMPINVRIKIASIDETIHFSGHCYHLTRDDDVLYVGPVKGAYALKADRPGYLNFPKLKIDKLVELTEQGRIERSAAKKNIHV